jgi:hypothetical protein
MIKFDESQLKEEHDFVLSYVTQYFKMDPKNYSELDSFIYASLKSIISLKIWSQYLDKNEKKPIGLDQYFNEIISNLNHVLLMGIIGYRAPSFMMIRRSLENYLIFLYYKDHPVEFYKREQNLIKREFLKIDFLRKYIEDYPFDIKYEIDNSVNYTKLTREVMKKWFEQYQELSNFVHGTNAKYLDLKNYLKDIKPDDSILSSLRDQIQLFTSIVNTLNILFFQNIYEELDEQEKTIVRFSIGTQEGFKKELQNIY